MLTEHFIPSDIFKPNPSMSLHKLSFCDHSVNGLKEWIQQRSSENIGDTTKELLNALIEISELEIPACLKFSLTQTIHRPIDQTIEYLNQLVKNKTLTESPYKDGILDLIQAFRCYMARLYSDIFVMLRKQVKTSTSLKDTLFRRKQNIFSWYACYLALEQFSLLTCHQHMLYRGPLPGQWKKTHRLYQLASLDQYDTIKMSNRQDCIYSQKNIHTIATLYKQIILLNILNTEQVRPSETYALYQCSSGWAEHLVISNKKSDLCRYTIQTSTDNPPFISAKNQDYDTNSNYLYINVNQLFKRIQLANLPNHRKLTEKEQLYLNPSLIFHITNTLNHTPERRYERYNFNSSIQIGFSLISVHEKLIHTIHQYEILQKKQAKTYLSSSIFSPISYDETLIHTNPPPKKAYTCNIIDISVNGYRMRWEENDWPSELQAGEFIVVQENSQSPWRYGLVRWIKQQQNQGLDFGTEILSQEIAPCYIQQYDVNTKRNTYYPTLVLKKEILNQPCFFLATPVLNTLQEQKTIELHIANAVVSIYISSKELINQSFILFNFDLLSIEDQNKLNDLISQYTILLNSTDL